MSAFRSDFLRTLDERGFIQQLSDPEGLDARLAEGPITGYAGFDCTADSFHVGNLVQVMLLYWFQQTGNRPLFLMGSGTTRIGDPSGKDEMRRMLTPEQIEHNKRSIVGGVSRLLRFGDGPDDALMVDNADWLLALNYIEFLRDYGRHFSINQMIQRESVRLRLEREQHLSLLEFNYSVLQAYDFVQLYRRHGCLMQSGGADQWGNIVSGVELGRRNDGAGLFAITTPLITTASGAKMGKTAAGAVWLNADRRSPYEYWQFWRNTEDADVGRFLRLFTALPMAEIARLERLEGAELNEAKAVLATEATSLLHGREAAEQAAGAARATFEQGAIDLTLPTAEIGHAELDAGLGILAALVQVGLQPSNGAARRAIQSGSVRLNDNLITDDRLVLRGDNLLPEGVIKLSVGRKRHALLKAV